MSRRLVPSCRWKRASTLLTMAQAASVEAVQHPGQGVSRIDVRDLFGRYSYNLAVPGASTADLSRVLVIYGDNGSGKTTILRLLFHLLSPSDRRGHRTFLARTPFRLFEVSFLGGLTIRAIRTSASLVGDYSLEVASAGETRFQQHVETDESLRVSARDDHALDEFMTDVRVAVGLDIYYVGDDRTLESDTLPVEDEEFSFVNMADYRNVYLSHADSPFHTRDILRRKNVLDLDQTVERATAWIRQQVIGASNLGGESTNTIYSEVVRRIARPSLLYDASGEATIGDLQAKLEELGRRNDRYHQYGLVPPLPVDALVTDLGTAADDRRAILVSVLEPFLDGLEARLNALAAIQETIEAFIDSLNSFYVDKRVHFSLHGGIQIETTGDGRLPPSRLSSGERQLLLLLTNTLYARDNPALFIIDEPEISLNMKWQRQLVDALIACTTGSATQFVLASHSFELISGVRDRVVHLTHGVTQELLRSAD